ncbi:hypothetical protein SPRG_07456 [Saprolegnia parasitica CBS 223.65]|uniref:Uncharacterized protein n=1 Tax=Saprolegnia parasitica (strain CBS 223.65) TaxID=695850 RepID=A0A067CKC1_SAPPC|nr:hypothetical protein SPRG_07456 [Saprolegnia parasitica CBS 223.65]KDO27207.1 hypothetical protein SPRG_07456 [Saprolegnia parasitica CBS 223.65]|eukprot:XP_012201985.1 hypothetical protein SPRG_07456 [Saprolegnia parasitica CBS 223.65]
MRFRAQLVVQVDGVLKHSKRLYDLVIDNDGMVVFKGNGSFTRSFPKPDKVVIGKRVLRISQGARHFLCRFPDPTAFAACVVYLQTLRIALLDVPAFLCQDSKKLASLAYCRQYFADPRLPAASANVQRSFNNLIFKR